MQLTVLEGSTFCVCDERGDVDGRLLGLYAADTRFLSRCVLTIDGVRPRLLTGGMDKFYAAVFYFTNAAGELEPNGITIRRDRFVADRYLRDAISVTNYGRNAVVLDIGLELAGDFADIFTIKSRDHAISGEGQGDAHELPAERAPQVDAAGRGLVFADPEYGLETRIALSQPAESLGDGRLHFAVSLEPTECWELTMDVATETGDARANAPRYAEERRRVRASLDAWNASAPRLSSDCEDLERAYARSLTDLAALRMRGDTGEELPAAGMPWFMTVFGRDTLITCLQTMLLGPELARNALRVLASLQAIEDDPSIDAEPGKIVHELRHGKAAFNWFARYYGTVDATPLFLVLLSEVWRWTGDDAFARELREPALRALEWIDGADLDGDGFVEYLRRAPDGIANQTWKDSGTSMVFADGALAEPPIAAAEVQGYVFDAKRRIAEVARLAWDEPELASRLEREAEGLRVSFDAAFWCGTHYALGLDRDKRPMDALASNIGHLLWSGIVPERRVGATVAALFSEPLWSGWGIRTLAAGQGAYNPLVYHNGTVWPHDNSLIAQGLVRYGRWDEARQVARAMIEASAAMEYQLPELFAGFTRAETPFPVAYPTASRPQAWAAATPVLLLQVLLGIEPDRSARRLVSRAPALPEWARATRLTGARAYGRTWDIGEHDHAIVASPA